MALYLEVLPGESVSVGTDTRITIEEKSGRRIRLRVDALPGTDISHSKLQAPAPQAAPIQQKLKRPPLKP